MAHDVFISHSAKDKLVADALCAMLEGQRIRCWIAPRDILPGSDWGGAIINAIDHCRVMVLVFSSHSNQSDQVKREVQNAVSAGIPILPLRIEDVPLSDTMRYFLGTQHWLDALTPPLEKHLRQLGETVKLLLSGVDGGPVPDAPASEAPTAPAPAEPARDSGSVRAYRRDVLLARLGDANGRIKRLQARSVWRKLAAIWLSLVVGCFVAIPALVHIGAAAMQRQQRDFPGWYNALMFSAWAGCGAGLFLLWRAGSKRRRAAQARSFQQEAAECIESLQKEFPEFVRDFGGRGELLRYIPPERSAVDLRLVPSRT